MNKPVATLLAQPPHDASYFFGFHDVSPWSPDDSQCVLLRIDPELRHLPSPDDQAQVVLWSAETGEIEVIGTTTTWNFQQGARAMWMPKQDKTLIYNRAVNGRPGAEIVDLSNGTRRQLAHAVGSLAPQGGFALAPDFARLGALWPAYGYAGFAQPQDLLPRPADDGLWRVDLQSGTRTLVVSIADLCAVPGVSINEGVKLFVSHVSFNRPGDRIIFMLRFFSKDVAMYSLVFSARPDGSELRLLAQEKISHFDWVDDETVVIWMRKASSGLAVARRSGLLANPLVRPLVNLARRFRGRLKHKLLNESYFLLSVVSGEKQPFMAGILSQDGHPMVSPDNRWMIVDEYPDPRSGKTPLMLVDLQTRKRNEVMQFHHDIGTTDSDMKCDLHPRWNRAGTQVGVDATLEGKRCFTVIDVSALIRGAPDER